MNAAVWLAFACGAFLGGTVGILMAAWLLSARRVDDYRRGHTDGRLFERARQLAGLTSFRRN